MTSTQYTDMKPGVPGGNIYQPQSQHAVIVSQPATVVVQTEQRPSSTTMIILSCVVFWCCCWPLGLAAFICAVMASSAPDAREAENKLSISKKLSIAGLVCGVILLILVVIVKVVAGSQQASGDTGSSP